MAKSALDGRWVADARRRARLDHLVTQRLRTVRDRGELTIAPPQTIELLCRDLVRVVEAGELWFLATCVCALIAELLLGSRGGGIMPSVSEIARTSRRMTTARFREWDSIARTLQALRNACFHPAALGVDEPHVRTLAERLDERGEARVASLLRGDYSQVRGRELFAVALRILDELGNDMLAHEH